MSTMGSTVFGRAVFQVMQYLFLTACMLLILPTFTHASGFRSVDTATIAPDDTSSSDKILAALYDVISGPAGQKRDWERMKSLFLPGARMMGTGRRPNGTYGHRSMTIDEYITANAKFIEDGGFFEKEIGRHTDSYGGILHVFSAYEARRAANEEKPFMRGINSIQLWNDGTRWWIVNVFWQSENQQEPLPAQYLNKQ